MRKFYDAIVVQDVFGMEGVLLNQIRQFFETPQKEKWEIQVFLIHKVSQQKQITRFKNAELTFAGDQVDNDYQWIEIFWFDPTMMVAFAI